MREARRELIAVAVAVGVLVALLVASSTTLAGLATGAAVVTTTTTERHPTMTESTPTANERIAANVRAEMARAGVRQSDLATQLHMTQSAISSRLRSVKAFDVDELAGVAGVLGVDVLDLLDGVVDGTRVLLPR